MRVLAIDPGAKRLGWAVLWGGETGVEYKDSGILECIRGDDEAYQDYRLRAMGRASGWIGGMLEWHLPEVVVCETLPVRGFNDMGQAYLALSVLSAIQGICVDRRYKVVQIGATTVKARIGGSNKATKVRVRNGVWQLIPSLQSKAAEWKKVYDESDAVAIGLTHLGYSKPK